MCGFVARVNFQEKPSSDILNSSHTFSHRGPDEFTKVHSSISIIGFARLAINDIEHGSQPSFFDKGIIGFGNGEVYNFMELRDKLPDGALFKITGSDIQVALEYLVMFGSEKIIEIEGMFALVLIDEHQKKVNIFRDRSGEKPLYYRCNQNEITVASMLSTLISSSNANDLDIDSIQKWCRYGLLPIGETFFKEIFEVKPGSYLEFSSTKVVETQYWHWPSRGKRKFDSTFSRELDSILKECACDFIQAEVPMAVALSSGLDSNAMNSYIRDHKFTNLNNFTLGFSSDNFDESRLAWQTDFSDDVKKHIISFDKIDLQLLANNVICFMDAPISDPGVIAFAAICSEVSARHKVVLTGDGADELLRGYKVFKYFTLAKIMMSILNVFNSRLKICLIKKLLNKKDESYLGIYQLFLRLLIGSLQRPEDRFAVAISNSFLHSFLMPGSGEPKFKIKSSSDLEKFFQQQNLPQVYLQKSDRASMAFSIEARSFFLHPRLISHFMTLRARHASKERFRNFLVEKSRIGKLPRKKHGLGVPMTIFMGAQTEPEWNENSLGIEVKLCKEVWKNRTLNPAYANLAWSYLVLNSMIANWSKLGKISFIYPERLSNGII